MRIHHSFRAFILLIAVISSFFSFPGYSISCNGLLAKLFPASGRAVLLQAVNELPLISDFYSKKVQSRASRSYEKAKKQFPRSPKLSAADKLAPFLDIEQAISQINEGEAFDAKQFVNQVGHWKLKEEVLPYLSLRLKDFKDHRGKLTEALRESEPSFKNAYFINVNGTEIPITLSFEKESHKKEILKWFRIRSIKEADWLKMTEKEKELAWEKWNKAIFSRSLTPLSSTPLYVSEARKEAAMRDAYSRRFNFSQPPVEVKHRAFEIEPRRLFEEMREVATLLGEQNAFHVHLAFPINNVDEVKFQKMAAWWKHVNDAIYLKGLEAGLHPSLLTNLPATSDLPLRITHLGEWGKKFYGVGLRKDIYGKSPIPGTEMIGFELRDSAKTLPEFEKLTSEVLEGISKQKWETFSPSKVPLKENVGVLSGDLEREFKKQGISKEIVNQMIEAEPFCLIPLHPYERLLSQIGNGERRVSELELFKLAKAEYLEEIAKTAKELRSYNEKGEKTDSELIAAAIRISLTQWAKNTRVSRYYGIGE